MLLYLPVCKFLRGEILKKIIRVLVSIFCILSSFAFIFLFFFMNNDNFSKFNVVAISNNKTTSFHEDIVKDNNNVKNIVNEEIDESNVTEEVVEVFKEEPKIVYDNMTLEELSSKLDRFLKNELSGKGYLYASYSLEKGVDPYLAVAISLEETGCNYQCSSLVKYCNNVGGMIGNGCNGFSSWNSLDDGIRAFIDNIYRNYVLYGLTTADTMNPKYAENPRWSYNVNNYINIIKNN